MYTQIFYSSFALIMAPLQVILKTDCYSNLCLDPNSVDSVLPKCRESLFSTSHSLTISRSFCETVSMLDKHLSAFKIAESSAYNKTFITDSIGHIDIYQK